MTSVTMHCKSTNFGHVYLKGKNTKLLRQITHPVTHPHKLRIRSG